MKMIGHDHFICHSYCHFSVLSHIILLAQFENLGELVKNTIFVA